MIPNNLIDNQYNYIVYKASKKKTQFNQFQFRFISLYLLTFSVEHNNQDENF